MNQYKEVMLGLHQQFCYVSIIFEKFWGTEGSMGTLSQLAALVQRGIKKNGRFQDQIRFLKDVARSQLLALKELCPREVSWVEFVQELIKNPNSLSTNLARFSLSLLKISLLFFSFRFSLQDPFSNKKLVLLKFWTIACIGAKRWNYANEGCFFMKSLAEAEPDVKIIMNHFLNLPGLVHDKPLDLEVERGIGTIKESRRKAGKFSLGRTQTVASTWKDLQEAKEGIANFLHESTLGFHSEKSSADDVELMKRCFLQRIFNQQAEQNILVPTFIEDGMEKAYAFFRNFLEKCKEGESAEDDE